MAGAVRVLHVRWVRHELHLIDSSMLNACHFDDESVCDKAAELGILWTTDRLALTQRISFAMFSDQEQRSCG